MVDEKIHRAVDVPEGVRRLVECPKSTFHEIKGRDEHIGDDGGNLDVELEERVEQGPHSDDPLDSGEHIVEHSPRPIELPFLALE